jgi:hypothetical protein
VKYLVDEWEKQYLDRERLAANEAKYFFSKTGKPPLERAICRAFLRCIGVDFVEEEIKTATKAEEPVDIFFRAARFQMREKLDNTRRRDDEWRDKVEQLKNATSIDDLREPYISPRPMGYLELNPLIRDALQMKSIGYGIECGNLDALVYVNLQNRFLSANQQVAGVEVFKTQGWRSVSMVFVPYASVLYANESAPDFLRERAGCVLNKWPHPEGWFEPTE